MATWLFAQDDRPVVRIQARSDHVQPLEEVTPTHRSAQPAGERPVARPKLMDMIPQSPDPRLPPIGSVQAWLKSMTNTPGLPPNWVECNGQAIDDPDSPYHGQSAPNLNGANNAPNRFLRGSGESGATGGDVSHSHGAFRSQKYGTQRMPVMAPVSAEHLPPYYDVTWIIRIK